MSRMPTFYRSPLGLPLYWMDEMTGELPIAVNAYLGCGLTGENVPAPTNAQIDLLRDYLTYYINAPCWRWEEGNELAELRTKVSGLNTLEAIHKWIVDCLNIGLDPL